MEAEWYIIHAQSGSENSVKQTILDQAAKKDMSEFFEDIVIPVVEVSEVKRGKAVKVEKKIMSGYILMKMNMTDDSWHLVRNVPKVIGFLGSKSKPHPLTQKEVQDIFKQIESEAKGITSAQLYDIGEQVVVIDGPFDTFTGIVEEVNGESRRLKVSISIFGKATPIDLSFTQVKKN